MHLCADCGAEIEPWNEAEPAGLCSDCEERMRLDTWNWEIRKNEESNVHEY